MQRTAVIYGLALSTLVAAFLLVPREKKTTTPDPVVPVPATDSAVTELFTSDGTISVTARLDRGAVLTTGLQHEPLWIDIGIKSTAREARAPLTTLLVIDRSGSMAGDKIEAARTAAERYITALRDGDQLGVITYGTDVTVDFPLAAIDRGSRARAIDVVNQISEGGGTNIDGGLSAARAALSGARLNGRVGRVVLISDGRPTEGHTETSALGVQAARLHDLGIGLSTLGVGLDYNEDLMELLAVQGGGRYHYLRDGEGLAKILDDELRHATTVAAANVKVHLPMQMGALARLAAPGTRLVVTDNGTRATLDVGDLAAGEERHVLVRYDVDTTTERLAFAGPAVTYRRTSDGQAALLANRADGFVVVATAEARDVEKSRRDDVRVRVLQVEASLELTQSMQSYAEGDVNGARNRLQLKQRTLASEAMRTASPALADEAMNLQKVYDQLSAQAPASAGAQDLIKEQKARAFELRR